MDSQEKSSTESDTDESGKGSPIEAFWIEENRIRRRQRILFAAFLVLTLPCFIVWLPFRPVLTAVCYAAAFSYLVAWALAQTRRRTEIVQAISERDDIRAIPILLDSLALERSASVRAAKKRLTILLHRLKESDAWLLTYDQRQRLYNLLLPARFGMDIPLQIAVLKALEQVGGHERFIKRVASLARHARWDRSRKELRVAAESCLETLKNRAEYYERVSRLLTPAEVPDNSVLVQPAGIHGSDSERLVRPVADSDIRRSNQ